MMQSASHAVSPSRYINFAFLAALFGFLFFFRLGNVPLFDLDEGLYVTCAQNMAKTGDLITPRLNTRLADRPDETLIPFYEKPIMVYWLAAAAMRLLGPSELAARLPAALAALLTTCAVLLAGTRWFGRRAGMIAAIVYAACPLTILDAREITPDGLLVLWFTGILLVFRVLQVKAQQDAGDEPHSSYRRYGLPLLFWALSALAVLTKGVIGLMLPVLIIGVSLALSHLSFRVRFGGVRRLLARFALRLRSTDELLPTVRALRPLPGLLIFLALAVPWFVLIWRAGGRDELGHTFVQEYILRQHIGRFRGLDSVHNMPLPSYLAFFLIGFFPWSCVVPAAFRLRYRAEATPQSGAPPVVHSRANASGCRTPSQADLSHYRFLLIWFWTVFIFFSLSAAKLPAYIAPAYPAAALLVGRWLDRLLATQAPSHGLRSLCRGAFGATVIGTLLVIVALIGSRFAPANAPIPDDVKRVAIHLTLLLACGNGAAWFCFRFYGATSNGIRAGFVAQAATMALLVGIGCTEGYAVAAQDVLLPYQRADIAARTIGRDHFKDSVRGKGSGFRRQGHASGSSTEAFRDAAL